MSCVTDFSITSHTFQFCKKGFSELLINGHVVFNEFMNMFSLIQGGRDMLKDVWKNVDMMDPENFDPKLFFKLHGNTLIFLIIDTIDLVLSQWCYASGNWMCQEHQFWYFYNQLYLKRLD